MKASEKELQIACEIEAYMSEQMMGVPYNPAIVAALLVARLFTTDDNLHVDGVEFGGAVQEILPGAGK